MHGRDVVVLSRIAQAQMRDQQQLLGVERKAHGPAHPGVVERLVPRLHARHRGLRRAHAVEHDVGHLLERRVLQRRGFEQPIDLARAERGKRRRRVVAVIDEDELVEPGPLAPVAGAAAEQRAPPGLDLDRLEGAGAQRADAPAAVVPGVEDECRVMEEVLRDGELRMLEIKP